MENKNTKMVYGLYGSHFAKSRACAYCHKHNCHLTVKTLKQYECLKKQCIHLKKHEEHDYWRQHDRMKEIRKARREEYRSIFA